MESGEHKAQERRLIRVGGRAMKFHKMSCGIKNKTNRWKRYQKKTKNKTDKSVGWLFNKTDFHMDIDSNMSLITRWMVFNHEVYNFNKKKMQGSNEDL